MRNLAVMHDDSNCHRAFARPKPVKACRYHEPIDIVVPG